MDDQTNEASMERRKKEGYFWWLPINTKTWCASLLLAA
jgi:hypothetical protein